MFLVIDLALGIPALLVIVAGYGWVHSAYKRASFVMPTNSTTVQDVTEALLGAGGAHGVRLRTAEGRELEAHYDPRSRIIQLSTDIVKSNSVAAIAVAAHEAGHAIQHAEGDRMFGVRAALAPAAFVASYGWGVVFGIGVWFQSIGLVHAAIAVFAGIVLFELVTLPVEIGASRRATELLAEGGFLSESELGVARSVLRAAAFTYVAALMASLLQLLRLLLEASLFGGDDS